MLSVFFLSFIFGFLKLIMMTRYCTEAHRKNLMMICLYFVSYFVLILKFNLLESSYIIFFIILEEKIIYMKLN